jgi:transcriptional regulator with XRE-family HTH domain
VPRKDQKASPGFSPGKLKAARRSRGMSRDQLAVAVGVSSLSVDAWEQGKYGPKPARVMRLVEVLGCNLLDLFDRDGDLGEAASGSVGDGAGRRSRQQVAIPR